MSRTNHNPEVYTGLPEISGSRRRAIFDSVVTLKHTALTVGAIVEEAPVVSMDAYFNPTPMPTPLETPRTVDAQLQANVAAAYRSQEVSAQAGQSAAVEAEIVDLATIRRQREAGDNLGNQDLAA